MSHVHEQEHSTYTERIPLTFHHAQLYADVFGGNLDGVRNIADIGAGDSDFALKAPEGVHVLRVDAQYEKYPPKEGDYLAARAQDLSEIDDQSVDAAVSVLMMQHIPHGEGEVAQAIKEMVRITRYYDPGVEDVGKVLIYPVWQPKKLQELLMRDYGDVAAIGYPNLPALEKHSGAYRMQTLMIARTKALDGDRLDSLAHAIEASGAFKKPKRKSVRDISRRALIALSGDTIRDPDDGGSVDFSLHY